MTDKTHVFQCIPLLLAVRILEFGHNKSSYKTYPMHPPAQNEVPNCLESYLVLDPLLENAAQAKKSVIQTSHNRPTNIFKK